MVNVQKLWAEAMSFATDISSRNMTTSIAGGGMPYGLWYGNPITVKCLQPFGTTRYMRKTTPEHKMAPREENCIMMGSAHNDPNGTVRELTVRTGEVVCRQHISWHTQTQGKSGVFAEPGGRRSCCR